MDTPPRAATRLQRDGSTVRFGDGPSRVSLTFCTPRIVRVELLDERAGPRAVLRRPARLARHADRGSRRRAGAARHLRSPRRGVDVAAPARLSRRRRELAPPRAGRRRDGAGAGTADGRARVHARFAFSGEQHFYGLGQGGGPLDRLGTSSGSSGTRTSATARARTWACRSSCRTAATRCSSTTPSDARLAGRPLGQRRAHRLRGRVRARSLLLPHRPRPARPSWARWPSSSAGPRCPRAGRSASSSRPGTSTTRRSCASCRAPSARSASRAMGSSTSRPTARPRLEPRRRAPRVPARALPDPAGTPRRKRGTSTSRSHPRVPGAPRGLAAVRRGRVAGLPPGRRATSASARAAGLRQLPRGPALPRLLATRTRGPVVVGGPPRAGRARRRGLVARRRRGPAGEPRRSTRGDGTLLHNIYDRFRHQAFAEGEASDRPDQRVVPPLPLGRGRACSASAPTCWSGDINNDFPTLEAQIPLGLNTGLSGVPYWGTDVGGFFHPVPETGELYARWFQLGAFSPIFRSHGWVWREHVPWAHGPEVEAICRRYAELRYQLLPYTYTLAWQAHTHGLPAHAPARPELSGRPARLDARPRVPVGRRPPGGAGHARGRDRVAGLSPRGRLARLLDRRRATRGPAASRSPAPLDRLPLLVRAGAILPMGPVVQHTGERPLDEVTLLIYPEGRHASSSTRTTAARMRIARAATR